MYLFAIKNKDITHKKYEIFKAINSFLKLQQFSNEEIYRQSCLHAA